MKTLRIPITCLTVALGLMLSGAALATTLMSFDIEQLSKLADEVAVARVVKSYPQWTEDGAIILTHTIVEVEQTIAGTTKVGDQLHIVQVGGEINGERMHMSGNPTWTVDRRVVVFVEKRRAEGPQIKDHYLVTGLFQGKYDLTPEKDGEVASRPASVPGTSLMRAETGSSSPHHLPLTQLIQRVRKARGVSQ